jgi:hypothetical protein
MLLSFTAPGSLVVTLGVSLVPDTGTGLGGFWNGFVGLDIIRLRQKASPKIMIFSLALCFKFNVYVNYEPKLRRREGCLQQFYISGVVHATKQPFYRSSRVNRQNGDFTD